MTTFYVLIYGSCLLWILLACGCWAGLRLRERDKAEASKRHVTSANHTKPRNDI